MEDHKERNAAWVSVPQFGDWDQKGVIPDYSMDFSKIREMGSRRRGIHQELTRKTSSLQQQLSTPTNTIITPTLQRRGGASSATSTAVSRPEL